MSGAKTADGVPIRVENTEHGFGNHPVGWEPTAADVPSTAVGLDDIVESAHARSLMPSDADKRAAFGEPGVLPDGSPGWRVDLRDPKAKGKHFELTQQWRRNEMRRSGKFNARPKVACVDRATGKQQLVFAEDAEHVMRKSQLRPQRSEWKGSPIVAGPDGMLFKQIGEHEYWPTGRRCLGTPLDGSDPRVYATPQRDPAGRMWMLASIMECEELHGYAAPYVDANGFAVGWLHLSEEGQS